MGSSPAVEMRGITKRYAGTTANDSVDLLAAWGELHAIVGENGAGKSTLMRILYGMTPPDEGEILLSGAPSRIATPRDAIAAGIGMVHQRFMLLQALSALDNIILGDEPVRRGLTDYASAHAAVDKLCKRFGFEIDLSARAQDLTVSTQQKVEIMKALYRQARILILDEPTSVLSPNDAEALHHMLRRMVSDGMCVILISHKLRDVMDYSDSVTVLRRGRSVASMRTADTDAESLASLMVGSATVAHASTETEPAPAPTGEPILRVQDLTVRSHGAVPAVDRVTFDIAAGEILGVAGVDGNGQRELAQSIVGLLHSTGSVRLAGCDLSRMPIGDRLLRGMAYIPESHRSAFTSESPVLENALLGLHRRPEFSRRGMILHRAWQSFAQTLLSDYGVRAPGVDAPVAALSGGNQQKLLLGRSLQTRPALLIACQPTRGLDFAATAETHAQIRERARTGGAVLLVSHDLDEILELSTRVMVMFRGRIAAILDREQATRDRIGALMMGAVE